MNIQADLHFNKGSEAVYSSEENDHLRDNSKDFRVEHMAGEKVING